MYLPPLARFAAFATALASTTPALAAPGPCAGVKLETGDFGGPPSWSAQWYNVKAMQLVPSESGGYTLHIAAQSVGLSGAIAQPGATAEVAFEDGTVWRDTLTSSVPGQVIIGSAVMVWIFAVPLDDERLKKLASTKVVNARIKAGDTVLGDKWWIKSQARGLMKAAACLTAP